MNGSIAEMEYNGIIPMIEIEVLQEWGIYVLHE
jgi:hypothetical protein